MRIESMKHAVINAGDLVYIVYTESEELSGWYIKVIVNGQQKYVSIDDFERSILCTTVNDKQHMQYVLYAHKPALEVLKEYMEVDELKKIDVVKDAKVAIAKAKVDDARADYEKAMSDYQDKVEVMTQKRDALEKAKQNLVDVENSKEVKYEYVYGVHTVGGQEFCWLNNSGLEIAVGNTVEVETKYGKNNALVTRICEYPEITEHLHVLRVVS